MQEALTTSALLYIKTYEHNYNNNLMSVYVC